MGSEIRSLLKKYTRLRSSPYEYASDLTNAKVIELDCGHYVHNFQQEQIAEEIRLTIK